MCACFEKETMIQMLAEGFVRIHTQFGEMLFLQEDAERDGNSFFFENEYLRVQIRVFEKSGGTVYRSAEFICKQDLILHRVEFGMEMPLRPDEFIMYRSFIDAPAAGFVRYKKHGFYTGAENPFFTVLLKEKELTVSYEPSLILETGEVYETEPQFLGAYQRSGTMIAEIEPVNLEAVQTGIKRPRFFNPCGEIMLDQAEIDAMLRYVNEYYDVIRQEFHNILYFFFYPKKQLPQTEAEVSDYLKTIDRFAQINGDMIAFNPHVNTVIPSEDKPYWELAPAGSAAEKILHYAQDKGMRCGYYMGCAFNGSGGNAALLPYMPHKTEWKKKDAFGNTAQENCLGCDEYLDWWFEVQKNTIEKYDLGYWSWDPGPGNGNDCYAQNHGHLPGKGAYKGWRNSRKLLQRLKQNFPELFLMSFYGRKEYGIWGFQYFSQHEVYWEQTVLFGATLHSDLSDDRMNAHGTRLQNQWSMHFRFLPASIGHGLVPRMGESWFDPQMEQAWDQKGWKHALLSAIACCGSVTHCTLPDKLDKDSAFAVFYRKWIEWARQNYRYCQFTRPVADRVANGVIDGFARIDKDKGQLFLFNSSPKVLKKKLVLDRQLGIETQNVFYLKILYFDGIEKKQEGMCYKKPYRYGDICEITLPPYGALVLELADTASDMLQEIPRRIQTVDRFLLDNGQEFFYPVHEAQKEITLYAKAVFKEPLQKALQKKQSAGVAKLEEKIEKWHKDGMPFTFTGALPHRLILYLPFDGAKLPDQVQLFLNRQQVPVHRLKLRDTAVLHYAFVEDYAAYGCENEICLRIEELAADSFLGIFVDYPENVDGMDAEEVVFEEWQKPSVLFQDPRLVIDSLEVAPQIFSDQDMEFTVTVKSGVKAEQIEAVYFVHPTQPQMPALTYDPRQDRWTGTFRTGQRCFNIFCNPKLSAWIKGKDGGVGPRVRQPVKIHYTLVEKQEI